MPAALGVRDVHEGRHPSGKREMLTSVVALPLVVVAGQPVVGGVHAHCDVELGHPLPEGVELGQGERAVAAVAGNRRGPDENELGPPLHHPLELLDRTVHDGQRDDRGRKDPALVVEGPVLVHPLVQRVDDDVRGDGVVGQALFEQTGQGRPHERAVEAELVHEREAGLGREERLGRADRVSDDFAAALPLWVAVFEELLRSTWSTDHVERGVRDVLRDHIANRDLRAAVDLDVLDQPRVLGRQELREGVRRLVHVVVGVEDGKVDNGLWHGHLRDDGTVLPAFPGGRR